MRRWSCSALALGIVLALLGRGWAEDAESNGLPPVVTPLTKPLPAQPGAIDVLPPATITSGTITIDPPSRIAPAQPAATAPVKPATTASAKRKRIEEALKAPANLPLEGEKTITLDEFLKYVREKHHISIRLDIATLRTLPADESSAGLSNGSGTSRTIATSPATCAPGFVLPASVPLVAPLPPAAAYSVGDSAAVGGAAGSASEPGVGASGGTLIGSAAGASVGTTVGVQVDEAANETEEAAPSTPADEKRAAKIISVLKAAGIDTKQISITVRERRIAVTGKTASQQEVTLVSQLVSALGEAGHITYELTATDLPQEPPPFPAPAPPAAAEDSIETGPRRSQTRNQMMAEKIGRALRSAEIAGSDIEIEFRYGRATISGTVSSESEKEKVVETVKSMDGVEGVTCHLFVKEIAKKSPASAAAPASKPTAVYGSKMPADSSRPAKEPAAAPAGSGVEITYKLIDGKAVLTGRVKTEEQKKKAETFIFFLLGHPYEADNRITIIGDEAESEETAASEGGRWHSDYAKAQAEAKRLGVPLLVHFHADWCGPCRQMEKVLESPKVTGQLGKGIIGVKVDIDADKATAKKFNVIQIPTDMILDPSGDSLSTTTGLQSESQYLKHLNRHTKGGVEVAGAESLPGNGVCAVPAPIGGAACNACPSDEDSGDGVAGMDALRHKRVAIADLALEDATIESALKQILEAIAPPMQDMEMGLPVRLTCMYDLDYIVQDDGVLITTKLAANLRKETRIYRIPVMPNCPPEQVAKVISQNVRPWSWRSQVTEIAEQFVAQWPKSAKLPPVRLDLEQGLKLASDETGEKKDDDLTAEGIAALGPMLSAGGVVMVQATIAALEIMHHGDPPTGVIQTLPGMLVITQSQSAHREIAELLEQLNEAARPETPAVRVRLDQYRE